LTPAGVLRSLEITFGVPFVVQLAQYEAGLAKQERLESFLSDDPFKLRQAVAAGYAETIDLASRQPTAAERDALFEKLRARDGRDTLVSLVGHTTENPPRVYPHQITVESTAGGEVHYRNPQRYQGFAGEPLTDPPRQLVDPERGLEKMEEGEFRR